MFNSGIYCVVNTVNNKRYIGQAVNLRQRQYEHFNKPKKSNKILQSAMSKYGKENFLWIVLEYVPLSKEKLDEAEQRHLDFYKDRWDRVYNIAKVAGSTLGVSHTEETKNKLRFRRTDTQKKKMSDSAKGNTKWLGRKHSEDSKKKISDKNAKAVAQLDSNNNVLNVYKSALDAQRKTKINHSHIGSCCKGKQRTAGDFMWMFEQDYLNGKRYDDDYAKDKSLKPILQFTKDNIFLQKFNSISEASVMAEVHFSNISSCCHGRLKSAGGYIWKFES